MKLTHNEGIPHSLYTWFMGYYMKQFPRVLIYAVKPVLLANSVKQATCIKHVVIFEKMQFHENVPALSKDPS